VLVWDAQRGRTSFTLLQRRLTAGRRIPHVAAQQPAHFVAFDLLRDGRGTELLHLPLAERRDKLARLCTSSPAELTLCPRTTDPVMAQSWMTELAVAGIEGVVVKPVHSRYQPGRTGWTKTRTRQTADFLIAGVTGTRTRPVTLLLGRYDRHGVLRYVAHTHPLSAGHRRELAPALRTPVFQGAGHPWPCPLPAGWTGDLTDRQPLPYLPVEPDLVAEVLVDTAVDGPLGRARHRVTHHRLRLDLRPGDIALAADMTPHQPGVPASGWLH
jgi:ATP-dependent DNA ligase